MRKLTLLFVGLLFAFLANAQTNGVLFSQNFEDLGGDVTNLTGWVIDTVDFAADGQNIWTLLSYDANYYMQCKGYRMVADTTESWLITPGIAVSNNSPVEFSIDVKAAYAYDTIVNDQLRIMISTDFDGTNYLNATWDTLQYEFNTSDAVGGYGSFQTYTYNLDDFAGKTVYIAVVYNGNNSDRTTTFQVDNFLVTDNPPQTPFAVAYTADTNVVVVEYEDVPGLFSVDSISASVSGNNELDTLYLDGNKLYFVTKSAIAFDNVPDTIWDSYNQTSIVFYAGIAPINYFNTLNPDGVLENDIFVTAKGYVTASDGYNQIWIADASGAYHGVLVYDPSKNLPDMVKVGDKVAVVGTRSEYSDGTEIVFSKLICLDTTEASPITPVEITGDMINADRGVSDSTAEPYEGVLVTIKKAYITSGPDGYYQYYATDDHGTTTFIIDDDIDYHWGSYNTDTDSILVGAFYDMTGIVNFNYGNYKLLPLQKDQNGLVLVATPVNEVTRSLNVYPNPAIDYIVISGEEINNVQVYNIGGQLIKTINANGQNVQVNVSDLTPGVYMIRVNTDKGVANYKLIKK